MTFFDLHAVNSDVKHNAYTQYGVDDNLAFEIQKRVLKYPQLLPIIEEQLKSRQSMENMDQMYDLLNKIDRIIKDEL